MSKRQVLPRRQKIADWWCSREGQLRIKGIQDKYGINLWGSLGSIEVDVAHCWACNKTLRGGSASYKTKSLDLYRCHIIPDSLGGSNEPSNLLLMCGECHSKAPDSNDVELFWLWFAEVEDSTTSLIDALFGASKPINFKKHQPEEILEEFNQTFKQASPILHQGKLAKSVAVSVLKKTSRNKT